MYYRMSFGPLGANAPGPRHSAVTPTGPGCGIRLNPFGNPHPAPFIQGHGSQGRQSFWGTALAGALALTAAVCLVPKLFPGQTGLSHTQVCPLAYR